MRIELEKAKQAVYKSKTSFCKFIAANDAGATGAHQQGFYIPKNSIPLMFDEPGTKEPTRIDLLELGGRIHLRLIVDFS